MCKQCKGRGEGVAHSHLPPCPQVQKVHTDKTFSWQLARISNFFSFQNSPKYCCMMYEKRAKKRKEEQGKLKCQNIYICCHITIQRILLKNLKFK